MTISNHSKTVEVVSLWEIISSHGVPKGKNGIGKMIDYEFTIHDHVLLGMLFILEQ